MLTLPPTVRVFVATAPVDLRKGFDGLSALVQSSFGHDPLSGFLFVFYNRRGEQVRILFFDRTGYCIIAKRLARGRFHFPSHLEGVCAEMSASELALILEGIDLSEARRHIRWRRPEKAA
jgi:transposase